MWKTGDITGSEVVTEEGALLGVLVNVLPSRANDIWVVQPGAPDAGEILIPALKTVVRSVDVAARRIVVALPPGLLDIYRSPDA